MSRYRAYQEHLAGRTVGQIIGRAATFVMLAGANAAPSADASEHAVGT